jgi:FkbM family methyltransferase
MRATDLERRNADTLAALARGAGTPVDYHGFVDVTFLPCGPFVMFGANDCAVAATILATGRYEPTSLQLWCRLAAKATGILDIGAYTGIYALAAAALRRDLTIRAFEPNPFSMARLRVNLAANALWNIEENLCGIWKAEGIASLQWRRKQSRSLPSNATFTPQAGLPPDQIETAPVRMRSLNDEQLRAAVGARPLMKIDVEGVEAMVFRGLTTLLETRPDIILETFDEAACQDIWQMLAPHGYRVFLINEGTGTLDGRDRLQPCDPKGESMNQLLTVHEEAWS